jgi:hypothetical protein
MSHSTSATVIKNKRERNVSHEEEEEEPVSKDVKVKQEEDEIDEPSDDEKEEEEEDEIEEPSDDEKEQEEEEDEIEEFDDETMDTAKLDTFLFLVDPDYTPGDKATKRNIQTVLSELQTIDDKLIFLRTVWFDMPEIHFHYCKMYNEFVEKLTAEAEY